MLSEFLENARFFSSTSLPKTVYFAITNDCNGRCTTCRFPTANKKRYVAYDDAVNAFDFLNEHGVRFVYITGGEPFLHPELPDICKYLHRRGMRVSYIPTNGIAVTEEMARELKEARVNIVGISVDPLNSEEAHRTRTIQSDHATLKRARSILEEQGVRTYAGILITKHLTPIKGVIDMLRRIGFYRVVFSYPQIDIRTPYRASSEHEMLMLDAPYVADVVREIKQCKRWFSIYNPDETLSDFVRSYTGEPQLHPCLGGSRLYYLDWNLELYRCFADPRSSGNILSMENLPCENNHCTSCTQQAFREMSYVLAAYDRFHVIKDTLSSLQGNALWSSLKSGRNWEYLRTLFQLYTGGFFS